VLYRAYLAPLVIMFSVPVAIVGALGILAICNALHAVFPGVRFFQGQSLNLFSMLGLVMLVGLVAKNGILLVDYANTLRGRGMALVDAIRESATIRFRPIVMTTVAMIAGMTPLALGITEGAEFRKSMGTVIIGGLTSSLFLTLFLVPVVYVWIMSRVDRAAAKRLARKLKRDVDDETALDDERAPREERQPALR
jgi:HAE1 family hydrophobic/amphiphilic exporter-1